MKLGVEERRRFERRGTATGDGDADGGAVAQLEHDLNHRRREKKKLENKREMIKKKIFVAQFFRDRTTSTYLLASRVYASDNAIPRSSDHPSRRGVGETMERRFVSGDR